MKTPLPVRLRRLAWTPMRARAKLLKHRWDSSVARSREIQARLLERILSDLSGTDFGRQFGLAGARTIHDLRRAMPVAGYDRVAPFIERVKTGQIDALLPRGTRLHMFAMTSGTTDRPKYIPITDKVLKSYRQGWMVWGIHALDDHFEAFGARLLQISSRLDEETTPSGVPAGAISGLTAHSQPRIVRRAYVSPPEASSAPDAAAKYYLACRLGLQVNRVMPLTANPSTLLGLARAMDARREDLLRDLSDGTLRADIALGPVARRAIERRLAADPARTRELEAVIGRTGHLYPRDVWQLPLIGTWKGGTLGLYLREMREFWGDAPVRDIGLIASEGRFSIPIHDEGSAGVLDTSTIFFEFVPEEEAGRPDATALLPHEVEVGRCYYIILTAPNGLVRYDIGDVVRVTGRMGPTPVIEFLNKGQHVSSLTGEKLTEHQVTEAVQGVVERLDLAVRNYCLAPAWGSVPGYSLLVEEPDVPADRAARLAADVDRALAELNIEYAGKRASGRLAAVCVKTLPAGAWRDYDAQATASRGGRVEQYKHKFLVNQVDFERGFTILATYNAAS
jgi:hypothetical protein